MRRIKATAEVKALKSIIRKQNQEIINLNAQIYELEHQLEESRSKEGKGVMENMMESLSKFFSSIDFSALMKMNPDLLDNEITIENDEEE